MNVQSDESSSEDSDSSSDSDDSDDEATLKKAANTKLPESGSSSDDSDKDIKDEAVKPGSDSSVTMGKTSPDVFPVSTFAPLPPDPAANKKNNRGKGIAEAKKVNEPFSRINRNIEVEEKFKSNRFTDNMHAWGQKAHEDLIVTKGKGFTKEKNKKKRGSYRGGFIDTGARNGIKFED